MADDSFVKTWGESSVFVLLAKGKDTEPVPGKGKRWFALVLLILMIVGATAVSYTHLFVDGVVIRIRLQ